MTDAEILTKVKTGLGITTSYQDDLLNIYIADVKAFMISAGVSASAVVSTAAVGCILRGVSDLWTYQPGGAKFSEYFTQRVTQLAAESEASGSV